MSALSILIEHDSRLSWSRQAHEAATRIMDHLDHSSPKLVLILTAGHTDYPDVYREVKSVCKSVIVGGRFEFLIGPRGIVKHGIYLVGLDWDGPLPTPFPFSNQTSIKELRHSLLNSVQVSDHNITVFGLWPMTVYMNPFIEDWYNAFGPLARYAGSGCIEIGEGPRLQDRNGVVLAIASHEAWQVVSSHGWTPIGRPIAITGVSGTSVYEIEGINAVEAYDSLLKEFGIAQTDKQAMEPALAFGLPTVRGDYSLYCPWHINREAGVMQFSVNFPDNCITRLMVGRPSEILNGSKEAICEHMALLRRPPQFSLAIDCIGRLIELGDKLHEEASMLHDSYGGGRFAGIASHGELGSLRGCPPGLHNKTLVLLGME